MVLQQIITIIVKKIISNRKKSSPARPIEPVKYSSHDKSLQVTNESMILALSIAKFISLRIGVRFNSIRKITNKHQKTKSSRFKFRITLQS